jgi:hypothetical protein
MTLQIPNWVAQSGADSQPPEHTWRGTPDFNRENAKLESKFYDLSRSATLAIGIAFTEWTVWRLRPYSDFEAPLHVVEAAWAATIDIRYYKIPTIAQFQERKGPIDGVLRAAKDLIEQLLRAFNTPSKQNVPGETVYPYFLARHVMPDKKPFDAWLKATLQRSQHLYPFNEHDITGPPVPRQAMDPTLNFTTEQTPQLLADYLQNLDPTTNPYLRTPDELLATGFNGTPYRLS